MSEVTNYVSGSLVDFFSPVDTTGSFFVHAYLDKGRVLQHAYCVRYLQVT